MIPFSETSSLEGCLESAQRAVWRIYPVILAGCLERIDEWCGYIWADMVHSAFYFAYKEEVFQGSEAGRGMG